MNETAKTPTQASRSPRRALRMVIINPPQPTASATTEPKASACQASSSQLTAHPAATSAANCLRAREAAAGWRSRPSSAHSIRPSTAALKMATWASSRASWAGSGSGSQPR